MRLVKPTTEEKMEITGNWRGDNNQVSTENQFSSYSVNTEGEHVKTQLNSEICHVLMPALQSTCHRTINCI